MSSLSGGYNKDIDEDNSMKHVLDIACIDSPKERTNRFNNIQRDYEALLGHAESLIDDNKDQVKEILTIFTKIIMRIKDSREKLKNLKTRLRVCKNTFSASFERAESDSHFYIRTKECVSLMKKLSFVVDASKSIISLIQKKNFLPASLLVEKVNTYLNVDLVEIDAVVNIRLDIDNHISNLYNAIIFELNSRLYDNKMLKNDSGNFMSSFLKLYKFPISVKKTIYDSWTFPYEEQFEELAESLKVLKKLKIGLNRLIKSFDDQIVKIFEDVVSSTHEEILENLGLSKNQNHSPTYDKKSFGLLLGNILQRLDRVHQKGLYLVGIFAKKLEGYSGEINEMSDVKGDTSDESNTELLEYSMHHSINKHLKLFIQSYLTDEETLESSPTLQAGLSTRTLHQVFSLRQRLSNTTARSHLYRFASGNTSTSENPHSFGSFLLPESCMVNICNPSIKYFKHIYLPLKMFVSVINSFYTTRNVENPFNTFLEKFFHEDYSNNTEKQIKKIIDFEYSGNIENYGLLPSKSDAFVSQYKLFVDFEVSQSKILRHMSYFPNHYADSIKRFGETFTFIKNVFISTINEISVKDGITAMSFQAFNSIPTDVSNKLYRLYQDKTFNLVIDDNLFFINLESLVASSIESVKVLKNHTMDNKNFETLIDILKSTKFIPKMLQSFSDVISSFNYPISHDDARNSDIEFCFLRSIINEIPPKEREQATVLLEEIRVELTEFYAKCFAVIYYEIRYHIIFYVQSILKDMKTNSDQLDHSTNGLLDYLLYLKEILQSKISQRMYKFVTWNITHFMKEYVLILAKIDPDLKSKISDIKRCISILQVDTLVESAGTSEAFPLTVFLDQFFMNFDQIINDISENGPKFDFETYHKILTAVKDSSISSDVLNRRLREVKKMISEAVPSKEQSD